MHTSRFHIVVAVVFLLVGISVTLRAQDQKSASHEERAKAVNLVRLINTAELWYARGTKTKNGAVDAHGRYASWDELYNSGVLKTVQDELRSQATEARVSSRGAGVVFVQRFAQSGLQWAMVKDLQVSAGPEVMRGCSFLPTENRTRLLCMIRETAMASSPFSATRTESFS